MAKSNATQKSRVEQQQQQAPETTRSGPYYVPRVDIYETDRELVLHADLPGVGPKEVDLRFERGELVLHARVPRPERRGHLLAQEYEEGDFYRVFQVHESIDGARIEAECKNGVLTVHLPKEEKAQPRQVKIKGE